MKAEVAAAQKLPRRARWLGHKYGGRPARGRGRVSGSVEKHDGRRFPIEDQLEKGDPRPWLRVDRVRAQIDELFASEQPLAEILEQVARLSVRLVLQTAVEAEVSVFLGRDRYQRDPRRGRATATATSRSPSRPPPGRSRWSGPSCAAPRSRSPPGSARTSPRPMRWKRW